MKRFFLLLFSFFLIAAYSLAQNKQLRDNGGIATTIDGDKGSRTNVFDRWKPMQHQPEGGAIFFDDMNGVNDVVGLSARGWIFDDVDGAGSTTTFQGNAAIVFGAYEGPDTGYVAQNYNGAFAGGLLIDQWLISPEVIVDVGDALQFWHRSPDGSSWPDPLEVWVSTTAGTTAADFDVQLDAFNASINGWAQWTGFFPSAGTVRFAVRYYTTDGGPKGYESNYVGLDFFQVGEPCIETAAANPVPSNGTTNVSINLAEVSWAKGVGAQNVEVWFDGAMVYDGTSVTSYTIPGPLAYSTTYEWWIVGKNDTCNSLIGPRWSFTTEADPSIFTLFSDDYTTGLSNWAITNDGGTCDWAIFDASGYTLPPSAVGNVMAADADFCGNGSSTLSTATTTGIDATMYQTVWLEFDNDWQAIDVNDFAMVDVSTDGGANWMNVLTFNDVDVRNTHEVWDLSSLVGQSVFDLRFVSVQPAWDWWWAVDNVTVNATDLIPVELTSFTAAVNENTVELSWSTATETNNMGFEIQRSSDGAEFSRIAFVEGHGTVTEIQNYTYADINLEVGSYSYRLKQTDFDGTSELSETIEVEIIAPDVFAIEQNYPNPFNPNTKIKFSLAADSKVTLKVFDVLGQEVVSLINGNLAAGLHDIDFNAANLNSGVYFYRIDATGIDGANYTSVKKMILAK